MIHHTYLTFLNTESKFNVNYVNAIQADSRKLRQNNLPVILTIKHLCELAKVNYQEVYSLVFRKFISDDNYKDGYKVFPIKKKNSTEKRWISVPNSTLMKVQKFINKYILYSDFSLHQVNTCCTAYIPTRGQVYNAYRHLGCDDLLKIDIKNFFDSISERQVYKVFKEFGYSNYMSFVFSRLCTRILDRYKIHSKRLLRDKRWYTLNKVYKNNPENYIPISNRGNQFRLGLELLESKISLGSLPQGAPTSPMLANLVAKDIDNKLIEIADRNHLIFTRYADDLVFSGGIANPKEVISEVYRILSNHGFKPNFNKTKFIRKGHRKIITGVCMNDRIIRVPRSYKNTIRQELYYIEKFGIQEHCKRIGYQNVVSYILRLEGKINYVKIIEPNKGNFFLKRLRELIPKLDFYKNLVG